jgi:UDP-N-acetyl-D-galactosamine dehydrogenase
MTKFNIPEHPLIAIIGLGYVGLPLAVAFAEKFRVVGFDINKSRINALNSGDDATLEITKDELLNVLSSDLASSGNSLFLTNQLEDLSQCNCFIITVPTPVDKYHQPDLTPLLRASETVAKILKQGDVVIYESTVYPGATEEDCVPILEKHSGLTFNKDFFVGYSPERINPGDKKHTVTKILKITSGSTPEVAQYINGLYQSIIMAGTYLASSIKVAEAAKVIENSQRDINIAFVNELAMLFNKIGIDTLEVLEAAGTKWNFLPFKPGLVGGHCIGVDPYYLARKAEEVGYHPEVLLTGRRINDQMGKYIAGEVIKLLIQKDLPVKNARILVLGITFKENCPDIRNTRVVDIISELNSFGAQVDICDTWANPEEVTKEYGYNSMKNIPDLEVYQAIILAVGHDHFKKIDLGPSSQYRVVFDVKGILDPTSVDRRL